MYVLKSVKDELLYTGCTSDLKKRLKEHNLQKVPSTRNRAPFELIYYEFCRNEADAYHREKLLHGLKRAQSEMGQKNSCFLRATPKVLSEN